MRPVSILAIGIKVYHRLVFLLVIVNNHSKPRSVICRQLIGSRSRMRFISGNVSPPPDNISDIHNLKSRYRTADTGIMNLDNLLRSFSAAALQQNEFFQSLQVFFADNGLFAFSGYNIVYSLLLCIQFCSGKFIFKTLEQFGKTEYFCFSVNTEPHLSAFTLRAARIPCLPVSPQQQRLDLPVRETVIRKALESVKKHLHFLKKFSPPRRTHRKLPALLQNSAHSLLAPHQRHVVLRKPPRHILLVLTVELPPVMPAELRTLSKILFRRRAASLRRVKIKSVPRVHCLDLLVHLPVKPVQNRVLPRFTEHRVKPLVHSHLVQKQIRNLRKIRKVRLF